ncbi:hypothetical protein [Dyella sp. 2RAB6]|uniref:hypothetical protein n=1 Tax=Dyella sp. 2RAB6 TaxID=3232992 RepID=UPI003F9371BD
MVIEEQAFLSDQLTSRRGSPAGAEQIHIVDILTSSRRVILGDVLAVADLASGSASLMVREALNLGDQCQPTTHPVALISESAAAADKLLQRKGQVVAEHLAASDAQNAARRLQLLEQADLADMATPRRHGVAIISERKAAADQTRPVRWSLLSDILAAGDSLVGARRGAVVVEALQCSDALLGEANGAAILTEQVIAADDCQIRVDALATVGEAACLEDEALPPASGTAWTANTDTWAASRYVGFRMESLAVIGGRLFGAGEGGLYALDGDDDAGAPIGGSISTGQHRPKGNGVPRGGYLYAPMQAARAMQVSVLDTAAGTPGANTYPFEARHADGLAQMRAKFGKGVRSLTWQFQVGNVDGGAFSIPSGMNWVIDPGSRRV